MKHEFTDAGVPGPCGELHNSYLRKLWLAGKSDIQLIEDKKELLARKNHHMRVLVKPRHWNDISTREFSAESLAIIDFWIGEIESKLRIVIAIELSGLLL